MAFRIRKGDLVQVRSGTDGQGKSAKQGRVIEIRPTEGKVRVQGVRMQKRHLKPGRADAKLGGIIDREGFVDVSNVMLVDPDTGKPSRVRTEERDGKKVRVFAKSGKLVPDPATEN